MNLVGKLNSINLSNEHKDGLNQLSFKGLKVSEGICLSSNEDSKRNCLSAVFTKNLDKPFKLGSNYEVDIRLSESTDPIDESFEEILSNYKLDKAELSEDEKVCTFTFHDVNGKGGFLILSALVDMVDFKTEDIISLYVKIQSV